MLKRLFWLVGLLMLLSMLQPASAVIENFELDFIIVYDKVYVEQQLVFDRQSNYTIKLPEDAKEIELWLDDRKSELPGRLATLTARAIRLSYLTKDYLERQNFVVDLTVPQETARLAVRLVLPEDAKLAKPIDPATLVSAAVAPRPDKLESDGRSLILSWEKKELKPGEGMTFFVAYRGRARWPVYALLAALILVFGLAAAVGYLLLRKPKQKLKPAAELEKLELVKLDELERYLKPDEAQIVRILKQREGAVEQGTLRIITGFSKAKLSGLLMELEVRNIIHKEKRGKKNLIFFKKSINKQK